LGGGGEGGGQDLGGAVPPGPNVEPPLITFRNINVF